MDIGKMQRKLSLWAEQDQGRKFYGLFDLIRDMDWLHVAYDKVATNAGSKTAGCDGIAIGDFAENLEGNLRAIRETLAGGTFEAYPVRRVYIPKANGKQRPLGIPSIRDRIVQEAVRMVLEPIYEADFLQNSYGFRPCRRTMDAIKHILWYTHDIKKFHWVIEGDISAYFDTINHRKLIQLLRRRVDDEKLLNLIWGFLRAGVMERKLFKDTNLGTPQGGIVSPLLANVYLHELDKYMEKYTALSGKEKTARRKGRQANFTFVRYADDWVALGNGSKGQAVALRDEIAHFLSTELHLTLSMEKTRVTHINDGFDFLGFHIRRSMGQKGMTTKVLISEKGLRRHQETLVAALSPSTHKEGFATKILALNSIIAGWCRYYQYVSNASTEFHRLSYRLHWLVVHWLGGKNQISAAEVHKRFCASKQFNVGEIVLRPHDEFHSRRYMERFVKPNPYTRPEEPDLAREELPDSAPWLGGEGNRAGMSDLRRVIIERDGFRCQRCNVIVGYSNAQVDHKRPVRFFKRSEDAHKVENLETLCKPCHDYKTEKDRQMESRVQ